MIWLIFLIPSEMEVPGWHDGFSGWSLAGYVVSIIGVFLFNNIVILPTIRKYRNKNSWVVEYSIELFISFSLQLYHDDISQRDWMSHSIVWEKRNLPFVYNDNNETKMLFVICIVHPPCVPCNTFGEQREIYEWIGLFRGALFFFQGGAFFLSGGRCFYFRGHFLGLEKSTAKFRGA